MAQRSATLRCSDLASFLELYNQQLTVGAVYLPPGTAEGELAREIRLDILVPVLGRVGPLTAQRVSTDALGGTAWVLPDLDQETLGRLARVVEFVDVVKRHLLATGEVVEPGAKAAWAPTATAPQPASPPPREPGSAEDAGSPFIPPPRGRGLLVPDVSGLQPTAEGTVAGAALGRLLLRLPGEKATGVLIIHQEGGVRRVGLFDKGGAVAWRRDPVDPEEVMGMLLLRAGRLTQAQLDESVRTMQQTGTRQGETLISMGLLTFPQLVLVLQRQVEIILQKVLEEQGTWRFYRLESLPEQYLAPPLNAGTLAYRRLLEQARGMSLTDLNLSLRPRMDRYVFVADDIVGLLPTLRWNVAERKFLEIVQASSWRLRELFTVSNMTRGQTAITVWALDLLGVLDFRQHEDLGRYVERIQRRVAEKIRSLTKATHFDVLELHWICLDSEVEAAYRRLEEEFDPNRYHDLPADLLHDMGRIRDRARQARDAVREAVPRRRYRAEVIERPMIVHSAELLARKGDMAVLKADRVDAMNCFTKALELIPESAEFRDGVNRASSIPAR